jgi:hypothetical protein
VNSGGDLATLTLPRPKTNQLLNVSRVELTEGYLDRIRRFGAAILSFILVTENVALPRVPFGTRNNQSDISNNQQPGSKKKLAKRQPQMIIGPRSAAALACRSRRGYGRQGAHVDAAEFRGGRSRSR